MPTTPPGSSVSASVPASGPSAPTAPTLLPPTTVSAPVPPAPFPVAQQVDPTTPRVLPSLAAPHDMTAPSLPPTPPPPIGPVKRWRALSGASMRQVIQAWAEEARVNVAWMSRNDYAVRYSVNKRTDFGRAVADLMSQYARDPVHPNGQLFNDPNGDRTLVVR